MKYSLAQFADPLIRNQDSELMHVNSRFLLCSTDSEEGIGSGCISSCLQWAIAWTSPDPGPRRNILFLFIAGHINVMDFYIVPVVMISLRKSVFSAVTLDGVTGTQQNCGRSSSDDWSSNWRGRLRRINVSLSLAMATSTTCHVGQ